MRRFVSLCLVLLAACSSTTSSLKEGDDGPSGPEPTDPVTFTASEETKKDLGIAKWGWSGADAETGITTFHGYDAKNGQLVELRQSLEETESSFRKRVVLKMTGKLGEASANIDVGVVVNADFKGASYTNNTIDNTFQGGIGEKVLAHLAPDAMAAVTKKDGQSAGLVQAKNLRPQDNSSSSGGSSSGGGLLNDNADGGTPLLMCCSQLTQATMALSATAAMSCATPLLNQSSLTGGRSIIQPLAIARRNGRLTVVSPWSGGYNIVDNHCHNAAAENSSKTDGYIGCVADSSSTTYAGHTINWAPNPYKSINNFCAYEPQDNNGTIAGGSICCFGDTPQANGAPSLLSHDARACVTKLCLGQANFNAGADTPQAFPAGSTPPIPNDCPSSTTSLESCTTCCTNLADQIAGYFNDADDKTQIAEYRTRCAANCQQAETIRNPPQADPNGLENCAPSVLQWQQEQAQCSQTCGK